MHLDAIHVADDPEPDGVNKGNGEKEPPNKPPHEGNEVDSKESEQHSNRERSKRTETSISQLKEVRAIRSTVKTMANQKQLRLDKIKWVENSSSDVTKPTYMKDVLKPALWNTKDKHNIETFMTKYGMYCDAVDYMGDEIRVKGFGSFLNKGASITFTVLEDITSKGGYNYKCISAPGCIGDIIPYGLSRLLLLEP